MEKTWKPTAAGFLCIIMGAIGLLSGVLWVLWILVLMGDYSVTGQLSVAVIGYWILGKIAGIVAIVGGIYARRRRIWRLALAGSICALFCIPTNIYPLFNLMLPALAIVVIPGILATIFVIRGKREFR